MYIYKREALGLGSVGRGTARSSETDAKEDGFRLDLYIYISIYIYILGSVGRERRREIVGGAKNVCKAKMCSG